jgi:serine protease Do
MGKALSVIGGGVKVVALAVGAVTTFVCGLSLAGSFVENGWLRGGISLVVMLLLPALLADRLLPKDDPARGQGIPGDVFALCWMAAPVLVAVVLGSLTRGALLREAEREAAAGHGLLARLALSLAGEGRASVTPAPTPSASTGVAVGPSGSASADAPSSAAPSASSAPPAASSVEPVPKRAPTGDLTPAELFKRLAPAVVTVGLLGDEEREVGGGTGFVIDRSGTIVTNHHVIAAGRKINVKFIDGAVYEEVTLLTDDVAADLALLRVQLEKPKNGKPPTFEPLKLGDSDAVVVGERAISIGNPLGLDHTLTDGLVSARRMIEGRAWIQMSVPVSPGNSGGPLFNMRGEVIGVTTAQLGTGLFGRGQNLNIAIPVKALVEHVRTSYPEARPFGQGPSSSHW